MTVVNPPFLKLMEQYEPTGLISTLSQEVFADIKVGRQFSIGYSSEKYSNLVKGWQSG